jgi:hypothetical protein
MTSTAEPCLNLYESRSVSRKGFRIEQAAGVAPDNCLNLGVHPSFRSYKFICISMFCVVEPAL